MFRGSAAGDFWEEGGGSFEVVIFWVGNCWEGILLGGGLVGLFCRVCL